jgi:hypothetical protein
MITPRNPKEGALRAGSSRFRGLCQTNLTMHLLVQSEKT